MPLTADQRHRLRELWLREGGKADTAREFWERARDAGLAVKWPDVQVFLRELPLPDEVLARLDALWGDRESSLKEFYDRVKDAQIPATYAHVEKYVKERPEKATERFAQPPLTGKSFANQPDSEWKLDTVFYTKRPAGDFRYLLVRVNSFSREVDAEPMTDYKSAQVAEALERTLARATVTPKTVLTDAGS